MLQSIARTVPGLARGQAIVRPVAARTLHLSGALRKDAMKDDKPTSEGHAAFDKANSSLAHDPQSSSAAEGIEAKEKGDNSSEPFDAAVQGHGNKGGKLTDEMKHEKKNNSGFSGSFADQIGGQPGGADDKTHATSEGKESAAGEGSGAVGLGKKMAHTGFENLKRMRKEGRDFSTSARAYNDHSPKETGKQEKGLKGDQNENLKHKSSSSSDKGKGNAASTPHLPSQSAGGKSSGDKRSMHTSTAVYVQRSGEDVKDYVQGVAGEPLRAGYEAPTGAHQPQSGYLTPPAPSKGNKASSELPHASSSNAPPNKVLSEQAKSGDLASRNPPPTAKAGEQGLDEAWKNRK